MVFFMHCGRDARVICIGYIHGKYGKGDGKNPDLRRHREEFDDWTLDVQVGNESIEVLCCPETDVVGDPIV